MFIVIPGPPVHIVLSAGRAASSRLERPSLQAPGLHVTTDLAYVMVSPGHTAAIVIQVTVAWVTDYGSVISMSKVSVPS